MSNETFSSPLHLVDPQSQTHFYLKFKEPLSSLVHSFLDTCGLQPTNANFAKNHTAFFCRHSDLRNSIFTKHADPLLKIAMDTIDGLNTSAWNCMKLLITDVKHPDLKKCEPYTPAEKRTTTVFYIAAIVFIALCIVTCIVQSLTYLRRTARSAGYLNHNAESHTRHNSNATPSESTPLVKRSEDIEPALLSQNKL